MVQLTKLLLIASAVLTTAYEAQLVSIIENSPLDHFEVRVERDFDGRVFTYTKSDGTVQPGYRYISSSTAKPVAQAAILHQVVEGNLTLETKAADIIPGWSGSGAQNEITLQHLLEFRSGLATSGCWNELHAPFTNYSACVAAMPGNETEVREPGLTHHYSTGHLDVAGEMARIAGGFATWEETFDAFRTSTGLFTGATWNTKFHFAASRQIDITTSEYEEFLEAVQFATILTPSFCAEMLTDQIPHNIGQTTTVQADWVGEEWHWGYGFWLECRSPIFDCTYTPRISTIGAAGQYAYIDRQRGYRFVISTVWDFTAGFDLAREMEPFLNGWAEVE